MSAYQARAARDAKAGEAAFWTAVAERHPEITTGDLDPLETFAFSEACERVIAAWLLLNTPNESEATHGHDHSDV